MSRPVRPRAALAALCAALFLTMVDTTAVSVALPDMQARLHAGISGLEWVVSGYLVVFAALLLTGGTLGDLFGRRRLLLAGLGLFVAASVLAALAPNLRVLIGARLLQGAGAAFSEPGTLSLLRQLYPGGGRRARAVGWWGAVAGVAVAAGPVFGGLLTDAFGWPGVFWINVPLGVLAAAAVRRWVPESSDPGHRVLDIAGQVLGALALAALAFGLIEAQVTGYAAPRVLAALLLAAGGGIAFVLVERRSARPVLDVRLFAGRVFAAGNLALAAASFGIFAAFVFLSLFLQLVANDSPAAAAAGFLPMSVAMVAAAPIAGRWTARSGPRTPAVAGLLVAAAGVVSCALVLRPGVHLAALVGALLVLGAGLGTALVPAVSAVLAGVPAQRSGTAAAVANLSRQIGGLLAVAILGSVTVGRLSGQLLQRVRALGLPDAVGHYVLTQLTTGTSPAGEAAASAQYGPIVTEVVHAAEASFVSGLHVSLALTAAVLVLAAGAAAVGLRPGDLRSGDSAQAAAGRGAG